jgi:hypothetical protein
MAVAVCPDGLYPRGDLAMRPRRSGLTQISAKIRERFLALLVSQFDVDLYTATPTPSYSS